MKKLAIVSVLGVVLCAAAGTYAAMQYLSLNRATDVIRSLKPGEDVIAAKIVQTLEGGSGRDLITAELKSRHEQAASLHQAYAEMATNWRARTLLEIVLWAIAGFFFAVVMLHAWPRRNEKG